MPKSPHEIALWLLDRLDEPSTWQGVAAIATLSGSRWALNFNWDLCSAVAIVIHAVFLMLTPDKKGSTE